MADYGYDKFSGGQTFYFHSDKSSSANIMGRQHYHNIFELYYLTAGRCSYFIDNKSYDITPGDLVIIPEGIIHKTMYDGGEHERKLINFSRHYLPKTVIPTLSQLMYIYRNDGATDEVRKFFDLIEQEYNNPDGYTDDALKSYIRLLFLTLARRPNTKISRASSSEFIESTVKYVQRSFAQDITLTEAARLHSVSPEHLSRRFKRETGFGFSEYLNLVRLQHAEQLLAGGEELSISEIAYASGFNDSNYFSDKFKKEYGISPLKFRNQIKK
ncbi:MAG: helix-turn-helix transcriptional regulator [Clostridia bacterium]|nr:helix-turn-helix transcriptional regulator [Clostridia bacterium]